MATTKRIPTERTPCETMLALRQALLVVNSKWKLPLIVALRAGTKHFRGLERSVPGISTKVLAKELKELEGQQLIARTVYPGPPVVVEYTALPYACSLTPVIEALKAWGLQHQHRLSSHTRPPEAVVPPDFELSS